MPTPARRQKKPDVLFWVALAFLSLVAATGGSSRVDVQSLMILKPVAMLVCALALITLRRSHVASHKWLFVGFAAMLALAFAHLVPLPPSLWQRLPGHQEIARVDLLAALGPVWRPLTLTPMNGWHALTALFVPLAMLLLAVQLERDDLYRFVPVVLLLGGLSGLLGLLQVVGGGGASLYLYRGTNSGTAAGLFANRNHAALLLAAMLPMLGSWAAVDADVRTSRWLRLSAAIAVGIVLFPMILVTGSRSGLLLSLVGLVAAITLFVSGSRDRSIPRQHRRLIGIAAAGIAGVALLALVALRLSKADAILRLINTSQDGEFRFDIWTVSFDLLWKYLPFGSGIGSFVEVYQIVEPGYQLNESYRNHAHQDALEIGITLGLPGLLLLLVGVCLYCWRLVQVWRRQTGDRQSIRISRMASVVIAMIAAASLVDYPLRTPTMMCIFVLLTLWFLEPSRKPPVARSTSMGQAAKLGH